MSSLDENIAANKAKHFLNNNDLSLYKGKQYFDERSGKKNYLLFLPINKYFRLNSVANRVDYVLSWKSKRFSIKNTRPPTTSDNSLSPELNYYGTKTRVKVTKSFSK